MNYKNTIIIPAFVQPNFLSVSIKGLLRNSYYKHKIIIVGSKTKRSATDFIINPDTYKSYRKYESMKQYVQENEVFFKENNIIYYDCSEEIPQFIEDYEAGKIYEGKTEMEDGCFIAFKNNYGMRYVDTEYVMPNWDDDFYPGKDWDVGLFKCADIYKDKSKLVFIPNHTQPIAFDIIPDYNDIWEDFRGIVACNRLTIPIDKSNKKNWSEGRAFISEQEWAEFVKKWSKDVERNEPCAQRKYLHYLPMLYKTSEFKKYIKAYNYQGSGYELEIDDRLAQLGFNKISPGNSFILHKGYIPYKREDV